MIKFKDFLSESRRMTTPFEIISYNHTDNEIHTAIDNKRYSFKPRMDTSEIEHMFNNHPRYKNSRGNQLNFLKKNQV